MRDVLPKEIYEPIERHLIEGANEAEDGWEAGRSEEDTLTGHLGSNLQTRWSGPIYSSKHIWYWRVRYKKFRGRGKGALEHETGADGIIQIEVNLADQSEYIQKGILFQAKKGDFRRSKNLKTQVNKMERIAPGASAVFTYEESGYGAFSGNEYLTSIKENAVLPRDRRRKLGSLLGEQFLSCNIGMRGLYYDAPRGNLIVPAGDSGARFLHVLLRHRISIDVFRQ